MSEKIKINEAVIVEGKYDKIRLSSFLDALIIETGGFDVFSQKDLLNMIRRVAREKGVIILTDSDSAGFVIRRYLSSAIDKENIRHVYIPEIAGVEKRKRSPSKEGLLGVEGLSACTLTEAFERSGVAFSRTSGENGAPIAPEDNGAKAPVSRADLYEWGLSGRENSSAKRAALLAALCLPSRLSSSRMLQVINALYSREEILAIISKV